MGQKYGVKNNSHTSEPNEFIKFNRLGLQAKMTVKPLSPMNICMKDKCVYGTLSSYKTLPLSSSFRIHRLAILLKCDSHYYK